MMTEERAEKLAQAMDPRFLMRRSVRHRMPRSLFQTLSEVESRRLA